MKVCFLDETTGLTALDDLKHKGRGGMVTSLRTLPDVLSHKGFDCYVISDIKRGGITEAGTVWYQKNRMTLAEKRQQYDCIIYNRQTCNGFSEIPTKHRILWTHDIPHNGFIPEPKILNAIDRVVFMSRYAEDVWRTFYPGIRKSVLIPNGVDKNLFYPRKKDPNYIIFASAPNRGLKWLSMIFGAIKSKVDVPVYCRAYSNMAKLHPGPSETKDGHWVKDDFENDYYHVKESGVDLRDPIPQTQLAGEMGRAGLMILPTEYPEICSNTILQALASGVPVITTGNLGSAGEWIKHGKNGFLTKYQPHDYFVCFLEMVRFALRLYKNPKLHKRMMRNAVKTKIFTWEQIGEKWANMLKSL